MRKRVFWGAVASLTLRVSMAHRSSNYTNPKRQRGIWGRSPLEHPFTGREGAAEGGSMARWVNPKRQRGMPQVSCGATPAPSLTLRVGMWDDFPSGLGPASAGFPGGLQREVSKIGSEFLFGPTPQ